jgi:site-specific recombinase XerD
VLFPGRALLSAGIKGEAVNGTGAARIPPSMSSSRVTFATRLAENGASESTMLALMGRMSRAMLERYSHIRMAAKREAVASRFGRKCRIQRQSL